MTVDRLSSSSAPWRRAQVRGLRLEAREVHSIALALEGEPVAWGAGAHVEIRLPGGLVRHYSLFNGPRDREFLEVAVKREPASRGGSQAMHQLRLGDWLELRPPRNLFALDPKAAHPVLLAGGIGITPLLAMFRERLARGLPVTLHYFARSEEDAAFAAWLRAAAAQLTVPSALQLHFGLDAEATAQAVEHAIAAAQAGAGDHLYVCGPRPFMGCVTAQAQRRGWPAERLAQESFGGAGAPAEAAPASADAPFELVMARSGVRCTVAPGQSIVAAAAAAGVYVPTACERGECGACLTRVVEGQPEHRDSLLTPAERAENHSLLPCVSRCLGARLVLDL